MRDSLQVGMEAGRSPHETKDRKHSDANASRLIGLKRQVEPPFTCRIFLQVRLSDLHAAISG
jgi:hypothetical protein